MAIVGIDLKACRDRLKAANAFVSVSDVESASAAMAQAGKPNCAFVCIASERADPNNTQAAHTQRVRTVLSVMVCLPAQRADTERPDKVEETRLLVIDTMAAWTPPGAARALDYDAYDVISSPAGQIWLQVTFVTGWTLRK